MEKSSLIWMDGNWVAWDDAKVHVLTHTLHYGLGVFEGIRCYKTKQGKSAIFRLPEHVTRLFHSGKILGVRIPFSQKTITQAIIDAVSKNQLKSCYIRPIAFLGDNKKGLNPNGVNVHVAIAAWPWGTYLGEEGLTEGIRVSVSSFTRHHVNISMTKAKACGYYINSILAKSEAVENGYDEALLLDPNGHVAEGSGENIFAYFNGALHTPPLSTGILDGITRDAVTEIAKHLDIEVKETLMTRDQLYLADEVFLSGTAAEITPVREIDRRSIGSGSRGPVTKKIQKAFFDAAEGCDPHFSKWLSHVEF